MSVSYIALSQIGFPRKQTLRQSSESRVFSTLCLCDHHVWKGEEGSRNGNREKSSKDAGPVTVSLNPSGSCPWKGCDLRQGS